MLDYEYCSLQVAIAQPFRYVAETFGREYLVRWSRDDVTTFSLPGVAIECLCECGLPSGDVVETAAIAMSFSSRVKLELMHVRGVVDLWGFGQRWRDQLCIQDMENRDYIVIDCTTQSVEALSLPPPRPSRLFVNSSIQHLVASLAFYVRHVRNCQGKPRVELQSCDAMFLDGLRVIDRDCVGDRESFWNRIVEDLAFRLI